MDRQTLRLKLEQMLVDNVGREFPNLKESDDLRDSLGLDSVDLVTLLIEIQSQFGITIQVEEVVNLRTVAQLLDHLQARLGTNRAAA